MDILNKREFLTGIKDYIQNPWRYSKSSSFPPPGLSTISFYHFRGMMTIPAIDMYGLLYYPPEDFTDNWTTLDLISPNSTIRFCAEEYFKLKELK